VSGRPAGAELDRRVADVVRAIPRGRVATYGQVAALAGAAGAARHVGRFLSHLPGGTGLPWHRVVNAAGRISEPPSRSGGGRRQRRLLEAEGVRFAPSGRIVLADQLWRPELEVRAVAPPRACR
jgi:methylated-DNA-protein-cysteine methyltransferase-like protein